MTALSNIADPESFYRHLTSLGVEIVAHNALPDHHRYSGGELESIEKNAHAAGAGVLIMTAKDEQNLPDNYDVNLIDKLVLDIESVIIEDKDDYLKIIGPYHGIKDEG